MYTRLIILLIFLFPLLIRAQDQGGGDRQWNQGQGGDRRQGHDQGTGNQWRQQNAGIGVVKGKIYDTETGNPIEYASVVIYRVSDSTMVSGMVTNEKGAFLFNNLAFGRYFMKLNFIGYRAERVTGIKLTPMKQVIDIGDIKFQLISTKLKEVEVEADKPIVEYKLDKKIVNVENNLVAVGGTVADVLQQVPSVTVDFNGNVSIRGNSNVTILIDGRQTLISQDQLQEIPASAVKSIELITNPSAKYNPDGMAGIIDIKMKEPKVKGFNAMGSFTIGSDNKYNGSMDMNWQVNKFNIFASYYERSDYNRGVGDMSRETEGISEISVLPFEKSNNLQTGEPDYYGEYYIKHTKTSIWENDRFLRYMNSNNFKLGTDYKINDKEVLRLSGMMRTPYNENNQTSETNESGELLNPYYNYFTGVNDGTTKGIAGIFNVDYKKKFDKKDELLTADIIYNVSNRTSAGLTDTRYFNPENIESDTIKSTNTKGNNNSTTLQVDYEDPIGEHSKLETGAQTIMKNSDNNYLYADLNNSTNDWLNQDFLDNTFIYRMQIYSGYGLFSQEFGKYSYQLGLRAEQALTESILQTTNTDFHYNYFSLYPSGNVTRKFGESQSMRLSYSRRVNRPGQNTLNPFKNISDPTVIREGNPYLKPEYINSLELGYLKYIKKKNTFNAEIFYKQINNIIKNIVTPITNNLLESTYYNLSSGESYGIDVSGDALIMKGWRANLSFSYFRTVINGSNINTTLSNSNYSWTSKLNTLINLPQNIAVQIFGNYRGAMVTPQGSTKPTYSVDFAMKKDILQKKASIGLRLADVFNTMKWVTVIDEPICNPIRTERENPEYST